MESTIHISDETDFTIIIYQEGDVYVADCPKVGTSSYGETIEEAIMNVKEVTELYLEETFQL